MIVYVDASALVKRYVVEEGSEDVSRLIDESDLVGTGLITRAEVSAALKKAVRMKALTLEEAEAAVKAFRSQWNDFVRVQASESLISKADTVAWEYDLRGYDAVHLASALVWQEAIGESVTIATYDHQLREASKRAGLNVYPSN
ncbi:MAG: type II toxin-antitoxin system VapC family toxin [Chloroflexi bacterium]|nr:type II toxin-antitoxin system VapC family toxin [Chloroflexota bacterium]